VRENHLARLRSWLHKANFLLYGLVISLLTTQNETVFFLTWVKHKCNTLVFSRSTALLKSLLLRSYWQNSLQWKKRKPVNLLAMTWRSEYKTLKMLGFLGDCDKNFLKIPWLFYGLASVLYSREKAVIYQTVHNTCSLFFSVNSRPDNTPWVLPFDKRVLKRPSS